MCNYFPDNLYSKRMRCPPVHELPAPPPGKSGWPWTEESQQLPDMAPDGSPWPKVSIVTPSYNQGQFIEESIRSVLLQGYPDLEFIIIDGGSTDDSVEIIQKYERWLTFWVSEPDRGQSHAINKGLEKCTGQLFNWQNADDVLTLNSLAVTAGAMVSHPDAGYAHGYRIVINRESHVLYETKNVLGDSPGFVPAVETSAANLTAAMQTGCLMRRERVLAEGGIDESLHYIMDRDILLRLALRQPPFYVAAPVVLLREHAGAKSLAWNATQAQERFMMARKIFGRRDLPASLRKLRRPALAAAHRFAWKCYGYAGMKQQAWWHVGCDVFYLPFGGWEQRRRLVKALARQHSSKWLHRVYRMLKKMEKLTHRD